MSEKEGEYPVERDVLDEHMGVLYKELRALVSRHMSRWERPGHTLSPTDVVHEAYLKLVQDKSEFKDSGHLRAIVVTAARNLLVDYARAKKTQKRGGGRDRTTLMDVYAIGQDFSLDVLDVNMAIEKLASSWPRQARVAELRLFGELTFDEIAEVMKHARQTVSDDWAFARAWLIRQMRTEEEGDVGAAE